MDPRCSTPAIPSSGGGRLVAAGRSAFAAVVIAAVVALTGCTSGPEPKPTPTPLFASETEAFAAAEQVYRDYVDAGNKARAGDKSVDQSEYLAGAALESSLRSAREAEDQGLKLTGEIKLVRFVGKEFAQATSEVSVSACVDVSGTRVSNADGQDITPLERETLVPLDLRFTPTAHGNLLVTKSDSGDGECPAG